MSKAIIVEGATKQFGEPYGQMLHALPRLEKNRLRKTGSIFPSFGDGLASTVVVAVDHVSFQVQAGEIFGLLGPSGSGKTTLLRLIATILPPDEGEISVFGYDVLKQPRQVRRLTNRGSFHASFFQKLSPLDNLCRGTRWDVPVQEQARQKVVEMLLRMQMEEQSIFAPMEALSRDEQQKVAVAHALLARPRVLLLDEPTAGLDRHSRLAVQDMLRELRDAHGATVLLSTSDAEEADLLCDRVAVLEGGKIKAVYTPAAVPVG